LLRKKKELAIDQSTQDPEDPEFSLLVEEKKKTIRAINQLGLRVTPAAVAASTSLSINQASFWLNKVAGETGGKLDVAADGTIFYSFESNFEGAYLERGFRKTLLLIGAFLFKALYWAMRVSFGVALVLSLLVILILFILVIVALCSAGGDSGSDVGGFDGFFDPSSLFDAFRWDYSPSISDYPNKYPSSRQQKYHDFNEKHPKGNFFMECFSFLFGDGNPNLNLQEIRWQQIARVIAEYGGVVSAEQLAPFLDGDGSDSGMIMNALAQFNGYPEVTESGNIVYVFPDFLQPHLIPDTSNIITRYFLREDHWRFSAYSMEKWVPVLLLALLNFAGSWWLFKHIATINLLHHAALLIDILLSYAIIFLAIPAIRALTLVFLNKRIDKRNQRRERAWEALKNPSAEVKKEIDEAAKIRDEKWAELNRNKHIIYTTEKDALEQQFEQTQQFANVVKTDSAEKTARAEDPASDEPAEPMNIDEPVKKPASL
jgi:hypothetical protein